VFYDLGAGLGRPTILAHLVSGAKARGVELSGELCGLARASAADLNLTGVAFIKGDAREVDNSEGTVFFLFTPFKGEIFRQVFARLYERSRAGSIRIATYGPCTLWAVKRPWLRKIGNYPLNNFNLALFESKP
jgi:SAM-dependent methyltransferase